MTATILYDYIHKFFIQPTGVSAFWAPYINNLDFTQRDNAPRGLGKSSPEEILHAAQMAAAIEPNFNGEQIKSSLVTGHYKDSRIDYKGTDCSGFIYHVLSSYLQDTRGTQFSHYLSLPKANVLNGAFNLKEWSSEYNLTPEEAETLPDDVPLDWVVDHFKRRPENLCNARGLVSAYSAIKLEVLGELKVGDIIFMSADDSDIPHVTLVVDNSKDHVLIAHSTRKNPNDTGGVIIEELPIHNGRIITSEMYSPHNIESFHRPKALMMEE